MPSYPAGQPEFTMSELDWRVYYEMERRARVMSETRFTKGPWTYESDGILGWFQISSVNVPLIAEAIDNEDNAHLIAAAPEMYEALENILAQAESWHKETGHEDDDPIIKCDGICECIPQMKAALTKARGE